MCKQGKDNMEKVEHYRWMWRQAGRNITVIENKAYAMGIFIDGGQVNYKYLALARRHSPGWEATWRKGNSMSKWITSNPN